MFWIFCLAWKTNTVNLKRLNASKPSLVVFLMKQIQYCWVKKILSQTLFNRPEKVQVKMWVFSAFCVHNSGFN